MTIISKKNLAFQNKEKRMHAVALKVANKELISQNKEKEKRAAELIVANKELIFQNGEKAKRAAELIIANKELVHQNDEKEKRAAELITANNELLFQNQEKEMRASELAIANLELVFQNDEKAKRAAELIIANKELLFLNKEKNRRAEELIISTLANTTKQKKDEEYIRHLAAIVESSDDAIISKSLDGIIKSWNKGGEKMFGYTAKQAIGKHISLIIPHEFIGEEKMILEQVCNNEIINQYETVRRHKDGKQFYVSLKVSPLKDHTGKIIGVSKIARDITLRKNAETELIRANKELVFQNQEKGDRAAELIVANCELVFQNEEKEKRATELIIANKELAFQNTEKENRAAELSIANSELKKLEEQFRLVVEYSPHAMVLISSDGLITLVNHQTEKLFGYGRDELMATEFEILVPEQIGVNTTNNRLAIRKDGSEIHVEISLNPIETAKGHMVLASIIDVTERKIQEVFLQKQNKEIEQFAYITSHDLQEPLRTISNYMKVFQEDYAESLDEQALNYLRSVSNAIKRMSMLVKSLLDFSRLNLKKKLVLVDCKKLVNDVIADLDAMILTTNASVEVSEMPSLNLYETEIRQMFQNLISNAIKFHKNGVNPKIQIQSEKAGETWKFSVKDNGIGISPIHFERVFDIFQCLHEKETYEGNGIGLANCKKIIQLHKGEIWVESVLGQGTTIHFTIPNLAI